MKKVLLIIVITFVFFLIFCFGYFEYALNAKGKGDAQEFEVKSGQSTQEVANNLKTAKLIKSPLVMRIAAKMGNNLIQVGVYKISPSESTKEILKNLSEGNASAYQITIPEGWRVTQIDEYLASKNIIKPGDLTKIASADEGYLFPDTYRFTPEMSAQTVRQMMIDNFNQKTAKLNFKRKDIILASIVEREAKYDVDRPKIASVYLNRLNSKMKLEADPTIQYAKGSWEPISVGDYHDVQSPYNTYLFVGLPPGPICNPGIKSIEAVLNASKTSYYYFFHKKDGYAVFSETLDEHTANLKNYQ